MHKLRQSCPSPRADPQYQPSLSHVSLYFIAILTGLHFGFWRQCHSFVPEWMFDSMLIPSQSVQTGTAFQGTMLTATMLLSFPIAWPVVLATPSQPLLMFAGVVNSFVWGAAPVVMRQAVTWLFVAKRRSPESKSGIQFRLRTLLFLIAAFCGLLGLAGWFPALVVTSIPFAVSIGTIAFARCSLHLPRRSASLLGIATASVGCALVASLTGVAFFAFVAGGVGFIAGAIVVVLYASGYGLHQLVVNRPDKYYIESE